VSAPPLAHARRLHACTAPQPSTALPLMLKLLCALHAARLFTFSVVLQAHMPLTLHCVSHRPPLGHGSAPCSGDKSPHCLTGYSLRCCWLLCFAILVSVRCHRAQVQREKAGRSVTHPEPQTDGR